MLEGLAASGLRAIRYAKEVPGIARVDANDLDPAVVDAMRRNVEHNGPEASSRVRPLQGDCRLVMMQVLPHATPLPRRASFRTPRRLRITQQPCRPQDPLLRRSVAAAAATLGDGCAWPVTVAGLWLDSTAPDFCRTRAGTTPWTWTHTGRRRSSWTRRCRPSRRAACSW